MTTSTMSYSVIGTINPKSAVGPPTRSRRRWIYKSGHYLVRQVQPIDCFLTHVPTVWGPCRQVRCRVHSPWRKHSISSSTAGEALSISLQRPPALTSCISLRTLARVNLMPLRASMSKISVAHAKVPLLPCDIKLCFSRCDRSGGTLMPERVASVAGARFRWGHYPAGCPLIRRPSGKDSGHCQRTGGANGDSCHQGRGRTHPGSCR